MTNAENLKLYDDDKSIYAENRLRASCKTCPIYLEGKCDTATENCYDITLRWLDAEMDLEAIYGNLERAHQELSKYKN